MSGRSGRLGGKTEIIFPYPSVRVPFPTLALTSGSPQTDTCFLVGASLRRPNSGDPLVCWLLPEGINICHMLSTLGATHCCFRPPQPFPLPASSAASGGRGWTTLGDTLVGWHHLWPKLWKPLYLGIIKLYTAYPLPTRV